MNLVRKGFVHLLAIVLFFSLLGGVAIYGINANFGSPKKVEKLLSDSKIYDNLVSSALDGAQQDNQKDGGDSSVPLNDPVVKQAAERAFSPQLLEQSANQFLDGNYAWLQGETDKPLFNINLADAKADFATQVGNYVTTRLRGLPACTPQQMAQLQIPVDPFKITCRPASLNPVTEGARVKNDILTNDDFLSQPQLTADSVGQKPGSTQKPYYQKLSKLPDVYKWTKKAPFILAGLALLVTLGIIFIHPSRRKGWRRVGVIFAEAGVILIVTKLIGDTLVEKVKDSTAHNSTTRHFQGQWSDLLNKVEAYLTRNNLLFGVIFLVIAIAVFVYLYRSREGSTKPKPAKRVEQPAEPAPVQAQQQAPLNPSTVAPNAGAIEDRLRQQTPTGPPTLGPNPPKRKPPRLIQ